MNIVCLDMEGVLTPEIWIAFANAAGIPELKRTTRDEPDYDKLMKYRLAILKEKGLGLKEIEEVIASLDPLPGAKEFLDALRDETQVVILSDTFEQFAKPLIKKLGMPSVESPAMPPNTTLNSTVVMSGFRMIHSGPRMVCLYMTVKLRLTNMTIRSR